MFWPFLLLLDKGALDEGALHSKKKNINIAKGTTDPRVEFILPK